MSDSLGRARGSVTIDTSQFAQAAAHARALATSMERALGGVSASTARAEKSLGSLSNAFRELAGVAGLSLSIAGIVQIGQATFELAKASAQADVTRASFEHLAAGAGQSAEKLLESMREASRGTISDANLILSANRALITGVADDTQELTQLLEIARATGRAFGVDTADAFSRIVRGISKLEPELLDELGITVRLDQVFRAYAASLGTTAAKLTEAQRRQALFNAVIEQSQPAVDAARKQGDNAADSYDRLGASWENAAKSFGKLLNTAGAPNLLDAFSKALDRDNKQLQENIDALVHYGTLIREILGMDVPNAAVSGTTPWGNRGAPPRGKPLEIEDLTERNAAIVEWSDGVAEIERNASRERLEATQQYESQRASILRDYGKSIAREAQDFALGRLRAEQDFAKSIADIHRDSARNQARQEEDFARQLQDARDGSAERIQDAREDANKRLAEMEEDYAKARRRAQEDHADKLMDAAGRLDAEAVYKEQRNFARQSKDAEDAHNEQREDVQEQLQERLDDEREALDERTRDANEAHERQLEDAREADAQRIADMQADFELRQEREDEDRGIRLERMAEDHIDQLAEMDRAHAERLAQIDIHAAEELEKHNKAFDERMLELGEQNKALEAEQARHEAYALAQYKEYLAAKEKVIDDMLAGKGGSHPSMADPYTDRPYEWGVAPTYPSSSGVGSSSTSTSYNGDIHVSIIGSTSMGESEMYRVARQAFVDALEEVVG